MSSCRRFSQVSPVSFHSDFRVGSALVFPSRSTAAGITAREFIRYRLKKDRPGVISKTVGRIKDISGGTELAAMLEHAGVLVPVPSHAPRTGDSDLWVSRRIAEELLHAGYGDDIRAWLKRTQPVTPSSSSSSMQGRTTVSRHFETISCASEGGLFRPSTITLVDDLVTMGSTLIACASRVLEQFPSVAIQAFAVARADRDQVLSDSKDMLSPSVQSIRYEPATDHGVRM